MEIIDKVVSTHVYVSDSGWKEKIKISDLKNVDSLVLIFARHAGEKGIKEVTMPGQFEAKMDGGIFVIKRFNEDVVGQFIKIISKA